MRGPDRNLSDYEIFNTLLHLNHTGSQWKNIKIQLTEEGKPKMHYTRIFRVFKYWVKAGCFEKIFINSVTKLFKEKILDLSIIHGDGTSAVAKKGGDNIGHNGHKHHKGDKVVAFCDRGRNVIAPFEAAPGNKHESPLLKTALQKLLSTAKEIGIDLKNSIISLDPAYDSRDNRKTIFNYGMKPNIKENPRNKKSPRGRKQDYSEEIYQERCETIERVFAWEDKFRKLVIRYEVKSINHYAFKILGYACINLRHFCA